MSQACLSSVNKSKIDIETRTIFVWYLATVVILGEVMNQSWSIL